MHALALILLMLAASTGLRVVADRWGVPYASLLVIGGLALTAIPNLPTVALAPDVLFLVFVPPLLYWGATSFPLRDLRRSSGPILRLAVLLVLFSSAMVAAAIHAIDPAFTWAASFALGAIVSPPDPVAVRSVMRATRLPREIERILEGEGLLNDASALVLYRVAVAAAATSVFSPWKTALQFFGVALGGVAIGLGMGAVVLRLRRLARAIGVVDNTMSLLTPFATYLAAEALGCSGVLAVVTAAMYIARNIDAIMLPISRLQSVSMWTVTTFLLESLAFILVGIEMPSVVRGLDGAAVATLTREAAVVLATMIGARLVWAFPSAHLGMRIDRWIRGSRERVPAWPIVLFIGWAGIRGADSLVIALTLPFATEGGQPFPARNRIIFITFGVILASLVIQAPTLRPLARALGLRRDDTDGDEEAHARLATAEAALSTLDELAPKEAAFPEVARYLRQRLRERALRWGAQGKRPADRTAIDHPHAIPSPASHQAGLLDEARAEEYRRIRCAMIGAERRALIGLRDEGTIGDDIMATVQRELDFEQIVLEGSEPVVEAPREIAMERP
ncbi:MAG TPA: Na+/H+ antiporter [Gemmatimonadaceae bacterium]|jgi:CPA1 family monovalent cation:H+ antiporter|nr:Na+/H+ antiporter [Gemmatimonadaceae bacterium]